MEALGKIKSHVPVSLDESSLRYKCPSKKYGLDSGGHSKYCQGKAAVTTHSLVESTGVPCRLGIPHSLLLPPRIKTTRTTYLKELISPINTLILGST